MEMNFGGVGDIELSYCKVCGEKKEKVVEFPRFDGSGKTEKRTVRLKCRCEREEEEAYKRKLEHQEEQRNIDKLKNLSLIDAKLKNARFNTYSVTKENERVLKIARNYVHQFSSMYKNNQGLMFWGGVGTGKSFTAAVIANELLERQCSVIMTSFVKLLDEMGSNERTNDDYIKRLNSAKLLVIDDLGVERSTNYALEKVYDIIDSRYRNGQPVIITTNLTIDEMKNCEDIRYIRIYDRIFEMCYPVKMEGMSWRKREAASRFENTKKILEG